MARRADGEAFIGVGTTPPLTLGSVARIIGIQPLKATMPFTISAQPQLRRMTAVREGPGDLREVLACIQAMLEHPDYRPGFDLLFDLRRTEYIAEGSDALAVANYLAAHRTRIAGRVALVPPPGPSAAISGRYLGMLVAYAGVDGRSFPTLEAALDWLDVPVSALPPSGE